jgi:hypothetical protein
VEEVEARLGEARVAGSSSTSTAVLCWANLAPGVSDLVLSTPDMPATATIAGPAAHAEKGGEERTDWRSHTVVSLTYSWVPTLVASRTKDGGRGGGANRGLWMSLDG